MPIRNQTSWRLKAAVLLALGAGAAGLVMGSTARGAGHEETSRDIHAYVASRLDDFTADMHLVRYDADAGRRISKDFGRIYEWMQKSHGDLQLHFKEPDKIRIDGRFGASKGVFIVNGPEQVVRLSGLGLNVKTNLGDTPGKRKTLLDFGLISSDYLSYTEAQYLNDRPFNGVMCAVFRISYRDKSKDTSHRLVWIDPRTKVTLKREEYSQDGKLRSIWYYHDPQQVAPGIYMPSTIEIDDNEGHLAGETAYRNVKVNQDIADSMFQ
jgi:outer membrane lipoprotein-sorting protein